MLLDERLEFANDVAVAVGVATSNVGDVIPIGGNFNTPAGIPTSQARDIGGGDSGKLSVVIQVTEAFTDVAGNSRIQFQLVSDGSATIAVDGTQSVHSLSQVFTVAQLVLGAEITLEIPPQSSVAPYELFLALQAIKTAAVITAGKVNAFISRDVGNWKAYAAPGQVA